MREGKEDERNECGEEVEGKREQERIRVEEGKKGGKEGNDSIAGRSEERERT